MCYLEENIQTCNPLETADCCDNMFIVQQNNDVPLANADTGETFLQDKS